MTDERVLHLLEQVRPPIDAFEGALINAFSAIGSVQAIWVREVRNLSTDANTKRLMRSVWLQLGRRNRGDIRRIEALQNELTIRTLTAPYGVEVHWVVDDLPPAAIAPSCIFRRGSGRV